MWGRAVPGGRGNGSKGSGAALDRAPTLSKVSQQQSGGGGGQRSYVLAGAVLVALLVTGMFTVLGPSLNLFVHLTKFARDESSSSSISASDDESSSSNSASSIVPPRWRCDPKHAKLRVFMYDLPAEFHYGMITEFRGSDGPWPKNVSDIPRYPGGLYQQHSPEFWLITDLLTSDMPDRSSPCTAFRVRRWQDADVMVVPFFASLSYNRYSRPVGVGAKELDRNEELQEKLLAYLVKQPAWAASNGLDHVLIIHHPNSMVHTRHLFRNATFIVADFGRTDAEVANMRKDVVAPYKHVIPSYDDDDPEGATRASFKRRATLMFFQGAIMRKEGGVIRRELYEILRHEPDVVFATGATTSAGIRSATAGMRNSKYCLHLAGDTPSSNRLFDAVVSHCVPLIISDEIELPFEDVLDYSEFCVFVNSTQALQKGFVTKLLRNFSSKEWARMHSRLRHVQRHFEYQHPTQLGDAVHMTWDAVARKVPALRLALHKRRRFARSHMTQVAPSHS